MRLYDKAGGTVINRDPTQEGWPDDGLRDIMRPQHLFLVEHQISFIVFGEDKAVRWCNVFL